MNKNKQKAIVMLQRESESAVESVLALSWICGWVVVAMTNVDLWVGVIYYVKPVFCLVLQPKMGST